MLRHTRFTIMALLGGLLSTAITQEVPRFYWYHFTIDRDTPVGESTALVFDKKGNPNIAYGGAEGNKALKFAQFDGTEWKKWEISRDRDQAGSKVAMALDSSDLPHIIYHSQGCTDLKYAWYDGYKWSSRLVDSGMNNGDCYQISIQTDSKGGTHVIYSHGSGTIFAHIAYAYLDSITFRVRDFLDNAGHSGKWNSLALDLRGRPCTAYYVFNAADLGFGFLDQGAWKVEKIEEETYANLQGFYPSMRLGSDDNFYVSFQSQTLQKVRLAYGRPGAWTVEDIADLNGWRTFSTPSPLALDAENNPYVAYYDLMNADLKLAYKLENVWHTETVDSIGEIGEWASIAMTPEGMPAISYYDATNGHLRLAIASVTPPLDSDDDGLPDYLEIQLGSDSFDRDFDDDGLSDGEEDLNQNGIVEPYETDPRNPDTDHDGIQDGVEIGRTAGIPPKGNISGTNPMLFRGDSDPSTTTNPLIFDTDRDGLADGAEDKDTNGKVDIDESDPNSPDTDGDTILDGFEFQLGTSPVDLDSDDDGLADNSEDKNLNGVQEEMETNPSATDTDGDGIADGIELGVLAGIPDPDGDGPLKGTAQNLFIPDTDPTVNSNPLLWDSDGDGLSDGEEDANRNGAVDRGESDFLKNDSDGDGVPDGDEVFFGSNPIEASSRAEIDELYTDSFIRADLAEWGIVDEGTVEGPSDWMTFENALVQTSNIWGGTELPGVSVPNRPGTFIQLRDFSGTDVKISFTLRSNDDDELGVLFRFLDKDNYYRFSMDSQQGYRRLTKIVDGNAAVITAQNFSYTRGHDYPVTIYAVGTRLQVYLDGRKIFDVQDSALAAGSIAFFTWKNDGALFNNVKIAGRGTILSIGDGLLRDQNNTPREFSLSEVFPNPSIGKAQIFLHSPATVLVNVRIFDILGRAVGQFHDRQNAGVSQILVWKARDEDGIRLPAGIYFLQIRLENPAQSGRVLWQAWRKVIRIN